MRRDLKHRLQAVENSRISVRTAEVWIEQSDGLLRGPRGEMIRRDEFEFRGPRVGTIVVLPDNGRDVMTQRRAELVISEDDARF